VSMAAYVVIPAAFVIPGDINLPTGGYTYGRRVLALLPRFGIDASHVELPGSFPAPTPDDLDETQRRLLSLPADTVVLIDGLAYGAMSADLVARLRQPIVALVHHPLCLEAGLSAARQQELLALETAALAFARRVIVTSATTARTLMADFAVPAAKITVAEPGTDRAARATGTRKPVQLVSVGSIVPRKAYDLLVRALAPLRDLPWRVAIAGATDRSPEAMTALSDAVHATGLADRVSIIGPLGPEGLDRLYATADVFVLPSLYEGYGMVLGEAMARGLPIICTTGGAGADTAPAGAAIKVPPGDTAALTAAIRRVCEDGELRQRMADASWAAGQSLPRWEDTTRRIADVIRELAP
jgi:glycosyltransferase involved in cell wall biosynthesis